uniref:Chondroitin proteoglycan 4 domain-containing protein n=1 Tax=Ascaris lumbricoides TaxID=6252 RepID=A0A0M3ID03_ASCLU
MSTLYIFLFLIANLVANSSSSKLLDEITESGIEILEKARDGTQIRQCSCVEQGTCVKETENDILKCSKSCFGSVEKLTAQTEQLRACFEARIYLAQNFLKCFIENIEGCVNNKNGPMIPRVDINELIRLGKERLHAQVEHFTKTLTKPFDRMLTVAAEIGECAKECVLKKNKDGFCFDRIGCQPKFDIKRARKTLRKCSKKIDWKREAGGLCECAVRAGIR